MNMSAVVNYARGEVALRTVERPAIGVDDVLVAVQAVSVCGSDVHQWQGTHGWPVNYPVILGHEFAGTVAATGTHVTTFREGDRVVSETAAVINPHSPMTRRGLYNLDVSRLGFGYGVDGAMAHFVRVPARCLHRLPDGIGFTHAALTEPCCVAYNAAVHHSTITLGSRVVILGPGPIGILCGVMAQLQGATVAIAGLERDQVRLAIAEQYGLIPLVGDPTAWATASDGLGCDGVIDSAGVSQALETALRIVRPAGWITKVGWGPEPAGFSLDPLIQKGITLRGSFSHNYPIWESVLSLLASGSLSLEPLIGGIYSLEEWRSAFEAMHHGRIVKAVLRPLHNGT